MTQPFLFEVVRAEQAAAGRAPKRVAAPPAPTANPTAGPWTLTINAPVMTVTVKDKKTKTKYSKLVPAWLTMNDRMYWRKRASITKDWRNAATVLARSAGMPVGVVTRARFDVTLRFKNPTRRDTVNWHPTAKVILDALTAGSKTHPGYGFLPDDAPRFLHCEECPHIQRGDPLTEKFGPLGQVILTVTDLSAEVAA